MRLICVDGDEDDRDKEVALCQKHPAVDAVTGFKSAAEALAWLPMNRMEFALLAVDLPDGSGIELAAELRRNSPLLTIVFLAEDVRSSYAAYSVFPQDYLLKPLDEDMLEKEIRRCLLTRSLMEVAHIEVKTFGNFEITVDGSAVHFKRSKAKELLALLVDKRGTGIPRVQAFTEMWEDREYDRKAQKELDVILYSLIGTLREHGISEILENKGGFLRIRPELISCDRYRFERGDSAVIGTYQGIYMYGYSWANWSGAFFD